MKKTILLLVLLAGFSWKGEAQHFIASFGTQHSWGVPYYVSDIVYDNYYDYNWVHATRIVRGGYVSFDVLLQRGDAFVEVNIGRHGRIQSSRFINYYPLHDHICGDFCGFHSNYYNAYYNNCNSHHHHGHNHVIYRPGVRVHVYNDYGYRYRRPYYNKTYYYDKGYRYRDNRSHGHHGNNNNHYNSTNSRNRDNGRSSVNNRQSDYKREDKGRPKSRTRTTEDTQSQKRDSKGYYTRRQ